MPRTAITAHAEDLGQLVKVLEEVVKMYGSDAKWYGYDDQSIIIETESGQQIYIEPNDGDKTK